MKVEELIINKPYKAYTVYGTKILVFKDIIWDDNIPGRRRLSLIDSIANEQWYYPLLNDNYIPLEEISSLEIELW